MKLQERRGIQQETVEKQRLATAGSHKHTRAREDSGSRGWDQGPKPGLLQILKLRDGPMGAGTIRQGLRGRSWSLEGNTATAEMQEQRERVKQ